MLKEKELHDGYKIQYLQMKQEFEVLVRELESAKTKMNIYKADAKLARIVVNEYADELNNCKGQLKDIRIVIGDRNLPSHTKIASVKKIFKLKTK